MKAYGPDLRWGDHVAIVGLQQTGKSTLARALVKGAPRVVIGDPKGDHARWARGRKGWVVVRPVDLETLDWAAPYLRVVVLLNREADVEVEDEVRYLVRKARECAVGKRRGVVLVLDELHLYSAACGSALRSLMAAGHGIAPEDGGVVSVMISQRGVDLPLGCRALATRAYCLAQRHGRDLERLADEFGQEYADAAAGWRPGDPPVYWEQERFFR